MSAPRDDFGTAIAIVGMAGRFPGAGDLATFWQHLRDGRESITFFTPEELTAAGVPPEVLADPDYVHARGVVAGADTFDAAFFGYVPADVEVMDPQHRLFLECAWTALEDAGYDPLAAPGLVGVFGGMSQSTYLPLLRALDPAGTRYGAYPLRLGTDKDYLTTRVSYKLHLRGPSLNVQTACSTSLVAVCQACQSLLTFQSDMALAGGVAVSVPLAAGHHYHEGGIFSPDGHCRPFDAAARGTVNGDGVGIVVLKRLADALADGDAIRAVIRGFALNNDGGAKMSFPAPSPEGQADAIATALAVAGVAADTIGYVEAHGTGTPLGDPIEIAGLTQAFRASTSRTGYCAIGSVKGNIGHTDTAAGVAGLIKTVLALEHAELPPTLHYQAPNPAIDFAATPFHVLTALRPWVAGDTPRRAGVSGFGLGGTNAHVVLEEAPAAAPGGRDAASTLLVLSAKTPAALDQASARLARALEVTPAPRLGDVAHTLRAGRHPFVHRRSLVARDAADAVWQLRSADPRLVTTQAASLPASAAFLFPGGGAQYAAMGQGLAPHAPAFRDALAECLELLRAERDLAPVIWPSASDTAAATAQLESPSWGLPALFAVEYALARQWMAWGVQPTALIGHSMGEYTAACLAGVLTLADALRLVLLRGRLFESLAPGGMVAVPLSEAAVRARLPRRLAIAAVNGAESCVVAGAPDDLAAFSAALEAEEDIECRRLRIAVAAHSPMVEPMLDEFRRGVASMPLAAPAIPIASNLTGTWLTGDEARSPDYWVRHLRETVRFDDGLAALLDGDRTLIEVGPGQTLSAFARQHRRLASATAVIPSMRPASDTADDLAVLQQAVGRAWGRGLAVIWPAMPDTQGARRVPLPTYPFERQRFYPVAAAVPALPIARQDVFPQDALRMSTPPPPAPIASAPPRVDDIAARLAALFQALSGMSLAEIRPDVPFLEMGFDSLFLTQATLRIKNEFKVRVTFRQLFEDAPTITALARFIDGKLPAAPSVVAPAATAPVSAAPAITSAPANASALERVVHEQLRVMSEQLRLLGGAPPSIAAVPASAEAASARMAAAAAAPAPAPATATPAAPASADASTTPHFGPFRGIDTSGGLGLTPRQQRGLDALVARYTARTAKSKALTAAQRTVLADPRAVGGFRKAWKEIVYQIATERSKGTRVWDIDGNEYLDLTSGFGVNLFGHGAPWIADAVKAQVDRGIELGTLSPLAKEAADLIHELTGMERVTFANTGSEAMSGAIRAVRTVTGREWIAVFDDEYHGMSEEVLVKSVGPTGRRRAAAAAPGIPEHFVEKVLVLHWNDPQAMATLRERADEIAGVIVEPVQGRHPDFRPIAQLRELRAVTRECGIPLIYDEMITGFRLHPRGAQGYLGVDCDLACYGKVISGGLPIAMIAGTAEYMDAFDGGPWQFGDDSFPEGGVTFFGGTFTRNVLSLSAAVAALRHLRDAGPGLYETLNARAERFAADVAAVFARHGAPMTLEHCASICSLTYTDANPLTRLVFYYMRLEGVHVWDRPFFLTTAHTEAELASVVSAFDTSLTTMREAGFFGEPLGDGPDGGLTVPGVVPFTEPQIEVWLGSHLGPAASAAFNEVVAQEIRGAVDLDALQGAVDDLVARHESLRMTVCDAAPGFRLAPAMPVTVTTYDLTGGDDPAAARADVIRRFNSEPLDLAHGPLWRVGLLRERDASVVVIAIHHLICDGWSFGVLLSELETCYAARRDRRAHGLPVPMQASEYARAEAERAGGDDARDTEAYWLAQYRTVPPPLELPIDRPRPAVATFNGGRLVATFDRDLAQRIRQFATAHRTTPFAALLAAFQVLVARLTGQHDFVVGVPMAGQALIDAQHLVAHCVNFIAMRCAPDPAAPFAQHVTAVTRQVLDVSDHQQFTYLRLLHALRLPRSVARDPLVAVSFTLEPSFAGAQFAGLPSTFLSVPRATSRRDLHINVMETPAGMAVEADYNADVLDAATVRAWLEAYRACLVAAVGDPTRPIGTLTAAHAASHGRPLDGETERQLRAWGRGADVTPPAVTVPAAFEAQAAATPDAVAVVCGGTRLTYGGLNTYANRLASVLASEGVTPGAFVALALDRSATSVVATLAVLKAGAAYVPLDLTAPDARRRHILDDTRPALVLATRASGAACAAAGVRVLMLEDLEARLERADDVNRDRAIDGDAPAYVMYTSGSTGQPKGVVVPHRGILRLVFGLDAVKWDDVEAVLHMAPTSFDASTFEIFGPLLRGHRVVVVPGGRVSLDTLADVLGAEDVDTLWLTAALFNTVVDERPALLSGVRQLLTGGEAVSAAHVRRAQAAWPGLRLINGYGPTETTTFACCHVIPRLDTSAQSVPIGRPLGATEVSVHDADGRLVAPGMPGELWIAGDGVALGYHGQPVLTDERFPRDRWGTSGARRYRTGDEVRWRGDGILEFLGRRDRQVKLRGFRIEPAEIEHALRREVRDAVVEHEGQGDAARLVAYVVPSADRVEAEGLRSRLRTTLPDYMLPAEFIVVGALPRTANGKLDRAALPAARAAAPPTAGAPAGATETALAAVWCELLGVTALDRTADFFLSGGHSLLALRLIDRIHTTLGVRLSPLALFETPRFDALAAAIAAELPAPGANDATTPATTASAATASTRTSSYGPMSVVPRAPGALAIVPATPAPTTAKLLARMADGGPGAPFFWVHGVGGEVYSYLHATRHLARSRPVYGFAADWTTAFAPRDRQVERIAAAYATALLAVRPEGPYHLGGYCSAAVLVLEIARQLEARGRKVGAFTILDYAVVNGAVRSSAPPIRQFARNLPRWIGDDALASSMADLAGRVRSHLRRRLTRSRRDQVAPADAGGDIRDALGLWRFPDSQVEMLKVHLDVLKAYDPRPFRGRATLLLPRTGPLLGPFPEIQDHGWKAIALGGVDVHSVPGSHSTFLTEPFAATVAERIDESIRLATTRQADLQAVS